MKITGVEVDAVQVTPWAQWIFVQVDTDAGIRGLGEMSQGGKQSSALEKLRHLEEALRGRDPRHIEQIVYDFTQGNPTAAQLTALCAVGVVAESGHQLGEDRGALVDPHLVLHEPHGHPVG